MLQNKTDGLPQAGVKDKEIGHNYQREEWTVNASSGAMKTVNRIRMIFEDLDLKPNPDKEVISLCAGDPTIFGQLIPSQEMMDAVTKSLHSPSNHRYYPSAGCLEARKAIASHYSTPTSRLEPEDICLASGCSHALDIAISSLCDAGDNILISKPGFPLYQTLCAAHHIECKEYRLLHEKNWEIDLEDLKSLVDSKTRAIVIENPSNPCSSVYSRKHLLEIIEAAEQYKIPIIADEVYAYMTFPGETFYPIASLTTTVPVLTCCALSKRFLCPGWRMGWLEIHDRKDIFKKGNVRLAINNMSQRLVGPNSFVQAAIPNILASATDEFFQRPISLIQSNAQMAFDILSKSDLMTPTKPQGAMYMMIGINLEKFNSSVTNCMTFMQRLMREESVLVLAGEVFGYANFVRLVISCPQNTLIEACSRIISFCQRNANNNNGSSSSSSGNRSGSSAETSPEK